MPGSYRIVDMFCLREVLNQIMKCSCRSGQGFSLYQDLSSTLPSFHCVLDIVCRSCRQKVSFGSSTLVSVASSSGTSSTRSDIDCKLNRVQTLNVRSLWCMLYQTEWAQDNLEDAHHDQNISGDPNMHHTQETEMDLAGDLRSDTDLGSNHVNLSCSLGNTASEVDCSVHLDCPMNESALDLVDCNINTSLTLTCTPGSDHTTMSCVQSKNLITSPCDQNTCVNVSKDQTQQKKGSRSLKSLGSFKTCNFCNKQFKKMFNLKQHVRTHTNERPLKCDHCEKRFNDRSSMNKHIRTIHADFRPHSCKICGKNFSSTSHVIEHQATHTNSKKFNCDLCEKKFAFRSSLNKHLQIHSGESKSNTEDGRILQLKDCELGDVAHI